MWVTGSTVTSKILLSGGCVLTLGAKTPNFTKADVLIDDGMVAEVGTGLRARDAEQVDATDTDRHARLRRYPPSRLDVVVPEPR